jgi:hypothetical protein
MPGKKTYVPPRLVMLGRVEEVPAIKNIFEEEKAKRKMRKPTKN